MPGPVAMGGGIGANAPKSKFTGILMVRPSSLYPLFYTSHRRPFPKDRFRSLWWYPLWL
jgi:hypothetical protein